jgi:putative sigma-54 modulation protein
MQINVTGRHLDLSERVKREAIEKMARASRLWDRFIEMEIVFDEDKNPRIAEPVHCEVTLHAKGRYLHAAATGKDHSEAIDRAGKKLERQVRKLKTRIVAGRTRAESTRGRQPVVAGSIPEE